LRTLLSSAAVLRPPTMWVVPDHEQGSMGGGARAWVIGVARHQMSSRSPRPRPAPTPVGLTAGGRNLTGGGPDLRRGSSARLARGTTGRSVGTGCESVSGAVGELVAAGADIGVVDGSQRSAGARAGSGRGGVPTQQRTDAS